MTIDRQTPDAKTADVATLTAKIADPQAKIAELTEALATLAAEDEEVSHLRLWPRLGWSDVSLRA